MTGPVSYATTLITARPDDSLLIDRLKRAAREGHRHLLVRLSGAFEKARV